MQNKRFKATERQTLNFGGGFLNFQIENEENTEVNYHGIRFKGRVIIDLNDATLEFGSGWVTLMCIPPGIAIPLIDSATDAETFQQFIIACETWEAAGGGGGDHNGSAAVADFNLVPKTSRNCVKGAQIVGQVVNESIGIQAVLTGLLSTFETTN